MSAAEMSAVAKAKGVPGEALPGDQEIVKPLAMIARPRGNPEGRRDLFATIVVVIALLIAMEVTSRYVPDYIMPSPVTVWNAARELFFSDPYHVAVTLVRLVVAVTIARCVMCR